MKKNRFIATLLVLAMLIGMLPTVALADWDDQVGSYQGYDAAGVGAEEYTLNAAQAPKSIEDGKVAFSKLINQTGKDTFDIELKVTTTEDLEEIKTYVSADAAVVLAIDVSGSMNFCAKCGWQGHYVNQEDFKAYHDGDCALNDPSASETYTTGNGRNKVVHSRVQPEETRLYAAKTAINSFVKSWSEDGNGAARYISIITYSGSVKTLVNWTDATAAGKYEEIESQINAMTAYGGTQTGDALKAAATALDAKSSIASRFVVLVTDGECASDNKSTAETWAKVIKGSGNVKVADGGWWSSDKYETGKKATLYTLGVNLNDDTKAWLKDKIASSGCNKTAEEGANITIGLQEITESISKMMSAWAVDDPMGQFIVADESIAASNENVTFTTDEDGVKHLGWNLWDETPSVSNTSPKKYTYTLTYSVTLDTSAVGFANDTYYPTNGQTVLSYGLDLIKADGSIDLTKLKETYFNVPTVKGTIPSYNYAIRFYQQGEAEKGDYANYTEVTADAQTGSAELRTVISILGEDGAVLESIENKYASTHEYAAANFASISVAANSANEIRVYYNNLPSTTPIGPVVVAYDIQHFLKQADGSYQLEDSDRQFAAVGETVSAQPNTYANYVLNEALTEASGTVIAPTVVDGKVVILTLKFFYDPIPTTPIVPAAAAYKVEHYLWNEAAQQYEIVEDATQVLVGELGSTVTAQPNSYPGYHLNEDLSNPSGVVVMPVATESGLNVLTLKFYYDKNPSPEIVVPAVAAYRVEHYLQQEDGSYEIVDEDTVLAFGEIGATVSAEANDYDHYVLNTELTTASGVVVMPSVENGELKVLVLQFYYDKVADPAIIVPAVAAYKVEHYLWNDETEQYEIVAADTQVLFGEIGSTVSAAANSYDHYVLNEDLTVSSGVVVMPTAGEDGAPVLLTLQFFYDKYADPAIIVPAVAAYRVEHYIWNDETEQYEIVTADTEVLFGEIGATVSAAANSYFGYHVNEELTVSSGVVVMPSVENGELVLLTLQFFYDKNPAPEIIEPMAAAYKVEHYLQQADGSYEIVDEDTALAFGAIGSTVTAQPNDYTGYHLNEELTKASGVVVMPSVVENELVILTLQFFYDKNPAPEVFTPVFAYAVEHYLQQDDGSYLLDDQTRKFAEEGAIVTEQAKSYTGYHLNTELTNPSGVVVKPSVVEGELVILTLQFFYDKNPAPEIIEPMAAAYRVEHYLQQDDGSYEIVAEDSELKFGNVGSTVVAEPNSYTGYHLNGTDSILSGVVVVPTMGEDGAPVLLTLKLYYDKNPAPEIIVPSAAVYFVEHYLQQSDGSYALADSTRKSAAINAQVIEQPNSYNGYRLNAALTTASGVVVAPTMGEDGPVVLTLKFYYDFDVYTLTVKHVDQQGNALAPETATVMDAGSAYSTHAIAIDGYRLYSIDGRIAGVMDSDKTVTFTYIRAYNLLVKYVDEQGNALASEISGIYNEGSAYETAAETIALYHLLRVEGDAAEGIMDADKTVIYVYAHNTFVLTVNYVDEQGAVLAAAIVRSVDEAASYATSAASVAGYQVLRTEGDATEGIMDSDKTVTYVYGIIPPTLYTLTVNFVDEQGNPLAASDTSTLEEGSAYTASAKQIAHYTLVRTEGDAAEGTMDGNKVVTFVYAAINYTLTVNYVDEQGTALANPVVSTIMEGNAYRANRIAIAGYSYFRATGDAIEGTMDSNKVVNFIYIMDEEPYEPEEPVINIPDDEPPLVELPDDDVPLAEIPDEDVPLAELPEEDVPLAELPQTGKRRFAPLTMTIGLAFIGTGLLLRKKEEEEEENA